MIGKWLFTAALAGGVFYGFPLWNEHTATACRAMEQRFLTVAQGANRLGPPRAIELAVLRRYLEPLSGGAIAAAEAKHHYPDLPPEIGCAAGYWASILALPRRAMPG